jgi:hypothetical protein
VFHRVIKAARIAEEKKNHNPCYVPVCDSFNRFSSIPWLFLVFIGSFSFYIFFRISNFFVPSITEETWVVEMCIWCIKIGIVLVLHSLKNTLHVFNFEILLTFLECRNIFWFITCKKMQGNNISFLLHFWYH